MQVAQAGVHEITERRYHDNNVNTFCKCKIEHCQTHQAAEELKIALDYARHFLAEHALAASDHEATKTPVLLPYLDSVLTLAAGA